MLQYGSTKCTELNIWTNYFNIITLAKHGNELSDDSLLNWNMLEHFSVNFNIFLEQSDCAFSWINKRRVKTLYVGKCP